MNGTDALASSPPEVIKACCAAAYEQDIVALLLGDSYHPGGLELTRRLARVLGLRPGQRVLDVASGPGTTARLLAGEFGVAVDGVDLGDALVEKARAAASEQGLGDRVAAIRRPGLGRFGPLRDRPGGRTGTVEEPPGEGAEYDGEEEEPEADAALTDEVGRPLPPGR